MNAKSYRWSYSGTGATLSGNSDSVTINFTNNATSGNVIISVVGNNNDTVSANLLVTVTNCTSNNGLIAWYPFNGNANDSTGNGHNGIVNGATLTTDRCGNPNSAYYFDGISNNITIDPNSFYKSNYTYALWYNPDKYGSYGIGSYLLSIGGHAGDQNLSMDNNYGGTVGFALGCYNNPSSPYPLTLCIDGSLPPLNQWYYVVGTRSDSVARLYINGTLIASSTTHNTLPLYTSDSESEFTIGCRYNFNQYISGKIDDVRIYNRSLDSTEILNLYNSTCTKLTIGSIAGSKNVCQGENEVLYSIPPVAGATSYTWSYSGTGATLSGNSDSVIISFANHATSGNVMISVTGNNNDTASTYLPITVSTCSLSNGMVAWYPFNGNANDSIANGVNGLIDGAILTTDRCGINNSAYDFNGSSYIQINNPLLSLPQYTYSLWASLNSLLSNGETSMLLSIGNIGGDQHIQYCNNYFGQNGWTFGGYNSGTTPYSLSQGTLPDTNQWYLITVTRSANMVNFYINGQIIISDSTSTAIPPAYGDSTDLALFAAIGARFDQSLPFNGKIDDVRIYDRVLADGEVLSLYNTKCNNLVTNNPDLSQNNLNVYPNPAHDNVTFECVNYSSLDNYSIKISNCLNQIVYESIISNRTTVINLKALTGQGIYFIYLMDANNNTMEVKKIILQ